jgi:hypothetical protein
MTAARNPTTRARTMTMSASRSRNPAAIASTCAPLTIGRQGRFGEKLFGEVA